MSLVASALLATICLAAPQATPTAAQETWLRGFEGAWGLDGAVGADANIVVNIAREGTRLVLRVVIGGREIVTRYDLNGADVVNAHMANAPGEDALDRTALRRKGSQ